jgi:Tfp pilus assembly protein FimT
MALVGIVFFFAVPRFEGSLFLDEGKQGARWLVSTLNAVREEAVRTHRLQLLHIDLEADRIWTTSADMPPEQAEQAAAGAQRPPGGGSVEGVEFPFRGRITSGRTDIRFHPDGRSDQALIHLVHGDRVQSFVVEPFLARVRILEGRVGFDELHR